VCTCLQICVYVSMRVRVSDSVKMCIHLCTCVCNIFMYITANGTV